MLTRNLFAFLATFLILAIAFATTTGAQTPIGGQSPSAGFRPLGSPSRVDQFKGQQISLGRPETKTGSSVQQSGLPANGTNTANVANGDGGVSQATLLQDFAMPNSINNMAAPAPVTSPTAPPVRAPSAAPTNSPLNSQPAYGNNPAPLVRGNTPTTTAQQYNQPSASDLTPVPTPQMNPQWSTTGNSPLVTSPSGYRAEFWDCGAPMVVPAGGSYVYAPATIMPNAPQAVALNSYPTGYRPIFTLGQENYNVQLGQGIIGQPTVYVPGQPFRNFFRYLSP